MFICVSVGFCTGTHTSANGRSPFSLSLCLFLSFFLWSFAPHFFAPPWGGYPVRVFGCHLCRRIQETLEKYEKGELTEIVDLTVLKFRLKSLDDKEKRAQEKIKR